MDSNVCCLAWLCVDWDGSVKDLVKPGAGSGGQEGRRSEDHSMSTVQVKAGGFQMELLRNCQCFVFMYCLVLSHLLCVALEVCLKVLCHGCELRPQDLLKQKSFLLLTLFVV